MLRWFNVIVAVLVVPVILGVIAILLTLDVLIHIADRCAEMSRSLERDRNA